MGLLKQGQTASSASPKPAPPAARAAAVGVAADRLPHSHGAVGAVVLNYKDIEQEAVSLLAQVRRRAGQLLAAAEQEARVIGEEIRAAAQAEGYAAGHADGLAKGSEVGRTEAREQLAADISTACNEMRNIAAHFEAEESRLRAGLLQDTVKLAVAVAERVCHARIAVDEGMIAANVRAALALVTDGSDVLLSVSPETMGIVTRELPQICRDIGGLGHVNLSGDDSLARGDCTLQTRGGWVDGRIAQQLKRVEEALLGQTAGRQQVGEPVAAADSVLAEPVSTAATQDVPPSPSVAA